MKHIKQFGSFSKLYENSGPKTTEQVIDNYKKEPRLWMMASDQYYNVITGVQGALEEIEQYYPNWTIEDFKEVYLAMEGELPEEEM
jgi:hypothetical protein